jgi:hypothetical protein
MTDSVQSVTRSSLQHSVRTLLYELFLEPVLRVVDVASKHARLPRSPRRKEQSRQMKVRAILWTLGMAYAGFILTGQDLRTLNSLSATEGFLGALAGFLLAVMFTLREKRRRPALIAHSIAQILPNCGIPAENRGSAPKLRH